MVDLFSSRYFLRISFHELSAQFYLLPKHPIEAAVGDTTKIFLSLVFQPKNAILSYWQGVDVSGRLQQQQTQV